MKKEIENELLENKLDELFNPVSPSNDFIDELYARLKSRTLIHIEDKNYLLPFIFISIGLFLGISIIYGLSKIYQLILSSKKE